MALITARPSATSCLEDNNSDNYLSSSPQADPTFYDSDTGPVSQHDNDHGKIQCISILPTADEVLAVGKPVYMPKKNHGSPNPYPAGPLRHLDLMFRYLRHESVHCIKDICYSAAQIAFLSNSTLSTSPIIEDDQDEASTGVTPALLSQNVKPFGRQETPAGHRFFLYQGVRIEELCPHEQHSLLVRISFDCPKPLRGRLLTASGHFENGMMIALLRHNKATHKFHIWYFHVHLIQSTMSMNPRRGGGRKAAVLAALMPDASRDDVLEFARYAQNLELDTEFCLVEFPRLMHHGFYHCLKKLQDLPAFAFDTYVAPEKAVYAKTIAQPQHVHHQSRSIQFVKPPEYSQNSSFAYNLGPVLRGSGTNEQTSLSVDQLAKDSTLEQLRSSGILDHGQAAALRHCLMHEFAFTQGPPGTGKTYLGIQLTRVLLASRPAQKPILVVCLTNHALDRFLGGLRDAGISNMIRIGSGSKEDWTDPFNLKMKASKARLSPRESWIKSSATESGNRVFDTIQAWCRSASQQTLTGIVGWYAIDKHLSEMNSPLHRQLKLSDNAASQQLIFERWIDGSDVRQLRQLRDKLLVSIQQKATSNRHGPPASEEESIEHIYSTAESIDLQEGAESVWKMPLDERRKTFRKWQAAIDPEMLAEDLAKDYVKHTDAKREVRKVRDNVDVRVLEQASIIGITTTACARRWETLSRVGIEIVIFEEAGEVMEPHSLCSLLPCIQHAISIGDPKQLRPEVSDQRLTLERCPDYRLNESLFERMTLSADPAASVLHYEQLTIQRRMHPDIADIARLIYPSLGDHESTLSLETTTGIRDRVFWWDHRVPEQTETHMTKSHINEHEVSMVTSLAQYLVKGSGYAQGDIAVLTPYTGQLAALHKSLNVTCKVWLDERDREKLLAELHLEIDITELRTKEEVTVSDMLRVTTIDNFQGEEAKVVILSTVRSGGRPGFLSTENRINVACSRARDGFYIIGNSETLAQVPLWRNVIDRLGPRRGFEIVAHCSNHPVYSTSVRDPKDFDSIIDCPAICGKVLSCGHECNRKCHAQALHERDALPCEQECSRVLKCGHRCIRPCGVQCGTCLVAIQETLLECGHVGSVLCSGELSQCKTVITTSLLSCGHQFDRLCTDDDPNEGSCKRRCEQKIDCDHPCTGLCDACNQRGHPDCTQRCGHELECGHDCSALCDHGRECPSCMQTVEVVCEHATRVKPCYEQVEPCMLPQSSSCQHVADLKLPCAFPQPVLPCSEACNSVLACGHVCPSLHGEKCIPLTECCECKDMDSLRPVLYVQECGHVVQVSKMDEQNIQEVFSQDRDGNIVDFGDPDITELKMPRCLCGTPCPSVHRYRMIGKLAGISGTTWRLFVTIFGNKYWYFSRQLRSVDDELNNDWCLFKASVRPDAVASAMNASLAEERFSRLKSLRNEILRYRVSVVEPFERAIYELQTRIHPVDSWTLTAGLRFHLLVLRSIGTLTSEQVRTGKHLLSMGDRSSQTQRSGVTFLQIAITTLSATYGHFLTHVLNQRVTHKSPALLAEARLHQVHFWLLIQQCLDTLNIESTQSDAKQHTPDNIPGLIQNLDAIVDTARRYPVLCASFKGTASKYKFALRKVQQEELIGSIPKPDLSSALDLELRFREYARPEASFTACTEGHRYSEDAFGKDACPECGVMVKLDDDQFLESGKHLFENDFLANMQNITFGGSSDSDLSPTIEHAPEAGPRTKRSTSDASEGTISGPQDPGLAEHGHEVDFEDQGYLGDVSQHMSTPEVGTPGDTPGPTPRVSPRRKPTFLYLEEDRCMQYVATQQQAVSRRGATEGTAADTGDGNTKVGNGTPDNDPSKQDTRDKGHVDSNSDSSHQDNLEKPRISCPELQVDRDLNEDTVENQQPAEETAGGLEAASLKNDRESREVAKTNEELFLDAMAKLPAFQRRPSPPEASSGA